ncbi:hypothetical protein Tco_0389606 [Tanacetum coccineum]
MANLSEDIQCAGSDTRPPMLDKTDFTSWQQRIRLYYRGKENGVNILKSIDEGPFQMGTTRVIVAKGTEGLLNLGPERPRVYSDLSQDEKDRYNADIRATNIILQGLPKDIYSLINHYTDAKDIWDNVKMLLEGSELTKEDRKSQLYDDWRIHPDKIQQSLSGDADNLICCMLVNDDADTGEDPKVAARFEDMKKEGTKAMNKGAFYTWLEALTKDLSTLPVPFSATYLEVMKLYAEKGYQDKLVRSFEVPPGLPKKSTGIRLTPSDEVQIRGGNKEEGTFISYDWQLPRDMYFDKANFFHVFYDKYVIVTITDIEPKPTRIFKKASS